MFLSYKYKIVFFLFLSGTDHIFETHDWTPKSLSDQLNVNYSSVPAFDRE
jgi:hypothetical protein